VNNIHMGSVLKSGGGAAILAVIFFLFTYIPFLGDFLAICFLCGGFLIPILAGIGYGYLAPGEEDLTQSAIGGALSGGVGGLLLGIFAGISAGVTSAVQEGIGEGIVGGAILTLLCVCGLGIAGLVFGAIGGAIWPTIQRSR